MEIVFPEDHGPLISFFAHYQEKSPTGLFIPVIKALGISA